jgi:putative ABC transport system substrate-binding protein
MLWPRPIRAQQFAFPVVGLLRSTPAAPFQFLVAALRQGLIEEGFVEGRNVAIEQRWADHQRDRLIGLAEDLVRRRAAVIVTHGIGVEAARAAAVATPIVFVVGDHPVKMGLVSSLNRPEGNLTGVTFFGGGSLIAKRLELLREMVQKATVIAVLLDPDNAGFEVELQSLEAAAKALGVKIVPVKVAGERDLDGAFARIVAAGADALLGGGPVLRSQLPHVVALSARHRIPTIYELRDYVEAGGLISYSASFPGATHGF